MYPMAPQTLTIGVGSENLSEDKLVMEGKTKKRKSHGRMRDVRKKIKLQSHEMGDDCKSKKNCFQSVNAENRLKILLESVDEQNSYL